MIIKAISMCHLISVGVLVPQVAASDLEVQTSSGTVQGRLASGTLEGVQEYLGIPFVG